MKTKLYTPRLKPTLVSRPHLIERLNAGLWWEGGFTRRLTLISAPAGFGKTTLLSEWALESQWPVAWISLDEEDNAPVHFLTYLIAALQTAREEIGKGLLKALQSPQPPPAKSILPALINEIDMTAEPSSVCRERGVILVLDDYHLIETQEIHDTLGFLIEHLPSQLHLVISTRIDPPLHLARLRARSQLLELRQADLRFTREEVGAFFNRMTGLDLSPDTVDALASRTEGWIAGLQMAAISMQRRDDWMDFVRSFTGSHRYVIDYLAQEVLSQQKKGLQSFLLQTSILDRMTDSLCDAVTDRDDSQAILALLERDNLFVVPLDDERRWYRYHRLFKDMLYQRLLQNHPQLVSTLHTRASAWCETHGLVATAVDHALSAGDTRRGAELIERNVAIFWARGEQATLLKWLDALPDECVHTRPRLCIFYALVLFTAGRNDMATSYLQVAQQLLDAPAGDRASLQGMLDAARAFVTFSQGDLPAIIHLSHRALDRLPEGDLMWRGVATYTLGLAQRLSGDLTSASRALAGAVKLSSATGNDYVALIARLNLARLQTQRGHLRRAVEILRQAIQIAKETGMDQLPVAGLLSAELGSILIEWNDLDEAMRLLKKSITLIAPGEDLIAIEMSYAFMTRALFAQGDVDGAREMIQKMAYLAEGASVNPWISYWIVALRLKAFLARGDLTSAAQLVEQVDLSVDEEPIYLREMAYSPLVQLYIAQGQPEATMGLLERLLRAAENAGRLGRVIATLLLRSSALEALGDLDGAMDDLARALTLAEPEGYVRVFVEQGPAMANLLRRAATRGIAPAYASQLLAAFDVSTLDQRRSEQPLIEPLTERELDVLRFLETDLTMEEIGQELFVTRSTIRSHAKSIYGKLNVHSRREAARRARALGLFD